jgi:hypothetical protein
MKQVTTYAPYLIASGAILAGLYFFWYKPKKDAEDAANAAVQAASDAGLTADPPVKFIKGNSIGSMSTAVMGLGVIH